jgi:hypothetical protein
VSEIKISSRELGDRLVSVGEKIGSLQETAAFNAAQRLVGYLKKLTDELGITDTGIYKNSHRASRTEDGSVVYNDAPHSGIVEMGTRPHFVGKDGIEALKKWCMRKLRLSEKEAQGAAWAIATKIAKYGTVGRWVYRDSQDKALEFYREELQHLMSEVHG